MKAIKDQLWDVEIEPIWGPHGRQEPNTITISATSKSEYITINRTFKKTQTAIDHWKKYAKLNGIKKWKFTILTK